MKDKNFIIKSDILRNKKILCKIKDMPNNTDTLVIPNNINIIENAFSNDGLYRDNIEKIIIPEGVERIGKFAFSDYNNIKKITLPKTLKKIGESAFMSCFNLNEVVLPEGLEQIDENAFHSCLIEKLYIPSTLTYINPRAFQFNKELKNIIVSKDNPRYSDCNSNVLFNKTWEKVIKGTSESQIPFNTKIIGFDSFLDSEIKSISLPDTVETIEYGAFKGCNSLNYIKLNDGLKYIEANAFDDCKELREITLPKSIISLGNYVFENCKNLETIYCNCDLSVLDDVTIFLNCSNIKNIYVKNINDINTSSSFYKRFKDKIKTFNIDELINQNKSFKQINKVFKENEKDR